LGDVRGEGLFLGIEIVKSSDTREPDSARAKQIVEGMKQQRILLSTDGPHHNVIKFKPPMTFDLANADRVVMALERVLNSLPHTP
jgi:4-aminobutyrate aminotransferase-like enzyme